MTSTKGAQQEEHEVHRASTPVDPVFEAFWGIYPRHIDKKRALKAFRANKPDPDALLAGAKAWAEHWKAERTEDRFIPHPGTWLNNERWLVAPPAPVVQGSDEIDRLRALMLPYFEHTGREVPTVEVVRAVAKMCAGPGEVAIRFAVAAKAGANLGSPIEVMRWTQDRVSRFQGDPAPPIPGDPVDYAQAMFAARSNMRWQQQ